MLIIVRWVGRILPHNVCLTATGIAVTETDSISAGISAGAITVNGGALLVSTASNGAEGLLSVDTGFL